MDTSEARVALLAAAREVAESGLVTGTSGNASLRLGPDRVLITPTSYPYGAMEPEDLVVVDMDGAAVEGRRSPSSEVRTHLAVYRARPDANAVLHVHSVFASVCAVAGLEVPPIIDELVVRVGKGVPLAEYAFPGAGDLGQAAVAALGEGKAVLLRNHGLLALGRDARDALEICHLVERVAQVFVYARLLGRVTELSPEVVRRELEKFREGQPPP